MVPETELFGDDKRSSETLDDNNVVDLEATQPSIRTPIVPADLIVLCLWQHWVPTRHLIELTM